MSASDTQERLQTLVKELPPELHDDVITYIESLLPKEEAQGQIPSPGLGRRAQGTL